MVTPSVLVIDRSGGGTSSKQTVTSFSVGVIVLSVVAKNARYCRYRKPLNWLSEAPLVVKNVAAVLSGPTKLKGPVGELLAATWNWSVVLAGTEAVQESVVQSGVNVGAGLLSLSDEMRSPDAEYPMFRWILKPASVLTPPVNGIDHTVPLVAPLTRVPPGYTLEPAVAVPLRVSAYVPGEGFTVGRITIAYCVPAVRVGGVPNVAV